MTVRKSYAEEFKREAVRLAKERGNVTAAARDLGLNANTLQNWKKQLEQTPENLKAFPGNGNPRDRENAQLQRENRRLKEEIEILKKAVGIFTVRPL
jgi:transposase